MLIRFRPALNLSLVISLLLSGCASTRQIAIDYPSLSALSSENGQANAQINKAKAFGALPGFQVIDGDDYYLRLISEFEFKGENVLKAGCSNIAPSYEKGDQTSALLFSVRNEALKFTNEVAGFSYQSATGKCNFKFEAKKLNLTPWMRLDLGKETSVDYSFLSSVNSDVDVPGLVNDVTAASSLLALTGVGMGVSVIGQVAGQWAKNNPQTITPKQTDSKSSSESHSLPAVVSYSGKSGVLNQTTFNIYAVAEGGLNILGADAKPVGELKIIPEITPSLLLQRTSADGVPDARDLSLEEIGYSPIRSAAGEIKLLDLIEQSKHTTKPNLKPNWSNYDEVAGECRKLKLILKDLGFNKFDRNAVIYYFLAKTPDWKNYNISQQKVLNAEVRPKVLDGFRGKDFSLCLNLDDYDIMKSMGLAVNSQSDWNLIVEASQKKEQVFTPLKSIERQLVSVLRNPNKTEMEQQLFPLLSTAKSGEGTVLLQNHLGDFGLEAMISLEGLSVPAAPAIDASVSTAVVVTSVPVIPGEGLVVTSQQVAKIFSGLLIDELSCARPVPDQSAKQVGGAGILLFTTKDGSPRAKGGAIEFEFSAGKINRIVFQSSIHRDFEQDLMDRPELGGCRIDPAFIAKLH
ncbi:MAG: hypothetical protein Q8N35_12230 [Methylococcaceae bacterium]|nr:hypothetical protein [Methylococcaceae bacterium]MDP3020344.1 hypothetical protein [Methylococcaceae bacterium]MDP3391951.1 hypothetical protein [Methylococcaceae bacterium]MDP3932706.1 hypothetical protein [Methylococcaceae bacterium]MDZ4158025.1 hypothetical protein [Methylococcales bacterium]